MGPPGSSGTLSVFVELTTDLKWVTFAPSFLIIFVGAPYMDALRNNKALGAVLTTITVVGGSTT